MMAITNMQNIQIKSSLYKRIAIWTKEIVWKNLKLVTGVQNLKAVNLNYVTMRAEIPKCTRDHKGSIVNVFKSYSSGPWPTNPRLKRNLPISAPETSRCLCQFVSTMYIFGGNQNQVSCGPLCLFCVWLECYKANSVNNNNNNNSDGMWPYHTLDSSDWLRISASGSDWAVNPHKNSVPLRFFVKHKNVQQDPTRLQIYDTALGNFGKLVCI